MRFFEGRIPSFVNDKFVRLEGKKLRSSLLVLMELEAADMCTPKLDMPGFHPPHIQV